MRVVEEKIVCDVCGKAFAQDVEVYEPRETGRLGVFTAAHSDYIVHIPPDQDICSRCANQVNRAYCMGLIEPVQDFFDHIYGAED